MSSSPYQRPFALLGGGLLLLAFFRALGLSQGSLPARAAVSFFLLLLAALALILLTREGVSRRQLLLLLLPIGLALFLRSLLLDHTTLDYQDFLSKWVQYFRAHGGFQALKDPVGNYNVSYLYFLALLSYLPIPDLYGIKLFSILFDVLLAWGGFRLAGSLSKDDRAPLWAFAVLLLLPTVLLNGSAWGQCDSIWGAFCVHALASSLEDKPKSSIALLALAFSFKLQAIFILPLWCALWFTGRVKFPHLFVFPGVFSLSMLPALLMGKPVKDILSIYLDQAGDSVGWKTLNYNSPSVFAFLPYQQELGPWAPKAAIALAFLLMLAVLVLLFRMRRTADNMAFALAGATLSLGIPFLLPYMHERYFFLGGVLLAVLACVRVSLAPPAAGAELASLGGYHAYLMKRYVLVLRFFGHSFTQPVEGALMLTAVIWSLTALSQDLQAQKREVSR